jgi:hypothetical protein
MRNNDLASTEPPSVEGKRTRAKTSQGRSHHDYTGGPQF